MKRFLRFCLLLFLPVMAMLVCYVILDPFKVIRKYEIYEDEDDCVGKNRGYISTMHYIDTKDECHYDSFIFGNSRSIAYHEEEWRKYIPDSSVCYHFDESGSAVKHLYCAVKFVSEHGMMKNALLVLDWDLLSRTVLPGHLFELCPALQDNQNMASFQVKYFKTFYNLAFLKRYIDYRLHKQFKPYMDGYIIDKKWKLDYNPQNNELSYAKQEESIMRGDYYNEKRMSDFNNAQFPDSVHRVVINPERLEFLKSIKSFFDLHNTSYRIVISPIYDQIKLNPIDLQCLYDIFGQEFVFDFSGVNQWNKDYHNYYESSHYRSCVANDIMRIVYSGK